MNTKPKYLQRDKRIMEWERELDGICVVTSYGFAFEPSDDWNAAGHVHIFANAKEARAELKYIRPCKCARCTTQGEEWKVHPKDAEAFAPLVMTDFRIVKK